MSDDRFVSRLLVLFVVIAVSTPLLFVNAAVRGYLPAQNPPWPPTYNLQESLITMQSNSSGPRSDPHRGADFGLVSYDWSNAKRTWAAAKPMNCEEMLLTQAVATKQQAKDANNNNTHVFVYRNIVKALPWFTAVREKLNDPQYAGFFLRFDDSATKTTYHVPPCAAENRTFCSHFYHDQLQTPQVPTPQNPHPDGACVDYCDCGPHHPCGEYVFDHRNGTMLRDFLVHELILGDTAVGHPAIDGLFLDDYWCSNWICEQTHNQTAGCPCDDPAQGPTEFQRDSVLDMGLSDRDVADITIAWNETMRIVEQALLDHNAYTWWLMAGQHNANAQPTLLQADTCTQQLRDACRVDSVWQGLPMLFGFTVVNTTVLAQLEQDLAFFLLARGPYAWAGWGVWGMTWPFNAEPAHGGLPSLPHGVPLPNALKVDYGVPIWETCYEIRPSVFARLWSHARVALDCNFFKATIDLLDTHDTVKSWTMA